MEQKNSKEFFKINSEILKCIIKFINKQISLVAHNFYLTFLIIPVQSIWYLIILYVLFPIYVQNLH